MGDGDAASDTGAPQKFPFHENRCDDVGFGKRESMSDFGRVLGELVDVVVVRAKKHESVASLAEHCTCSVINGLTDFLHPCQAMADLQKWLSKWSGKYPRLCEWVEANIEETWTFYRLPRQHLLAVSKHA